MSRYSYDIDDALCCDGEYMGSDEIIAALEERDALKAHVERWRQAWEVCAESGFEEMLGEVYGEAPTTSLARLKAEWQAEGMDALADRLEWGVVVDHIKEEAEWLRRQAEGGE